LAKLYFRYGAVSSAKSLNLLAVAHNYTQQGKRVLLVKPRLDTRWEADLVQSRAGLERKADLLVDDDSLLEPADFRELHCLLVDEAQFLSEAVVDQLRVITKTVNVPVICYGLRTDFRTRLFVGARRLMEVADAIEEIKTTCAFCNSKAIFNLKLLDGVPTLEGPSVEMGAEEKFLPTCYYCYTERLAERGESLGHLGEGPG